jgi:peptidoglycan/LPS O-acetylase OafA/YrhL
MTESTKKHLLYLDGWRGIGLLLVIAGHFLPIPGINVGRLGVELFFVLSGRLMAEILFIKGTSLLEFYKRRISRIFPALLVFVILFVAFDYVNSGSLIPPKMIASSLFFYSNYMAAIFGERIPSMEHTWSLAVEEHGYIVLSLIMLVTVARRRGAVYFIWFLAVAAIINAGWQTYTLGSGYYEEFWRSDVRLASILISAAICIHVNNKPFITNPVVLFSIGGFGVLLSVNPVPDIIKYSLGTLCFALVVNHAAYLPQAVRTFLSNKFLVVFGVCSYSLYLWQQPFYKGIHGWGSRPFMLIGALTAGFFSYYLIEKPARKWINNYSFSSKK